MSTNCKNDAWVEIINPCKLKKPELFECHNTGMVDYLKAIGHRPNVFIWPKKISYFLGSV